MSTHCPTHHLIAQQTRKEPMMAHTSPTLKSLIAPIRGMPLVLALGLGTTTGWAMRGHDGLITSGTVSFRARRSDGGGMR